MRATCILLFSQTSEIYEESKTEVANDSDLAVKFPAAVIQHAGLAKFIYDRLIPAINKEGSTTGEIRLNVSFSRFSESSPVSVDLKLTGDNILRPLSFVDKAKEGRAYLCQGEVELLIHDEDSIAIKEGFIVRNEGDSLEVNKKYWTKIGIDDSEFFSYYFGLTIDRDSLYLDTYKYYGAGYNVGLLDEKTIRGILPKKSKAALERERRRDSKRTGSPNITFKFDLK